MKNAELRQQVTAALGAAESKKASDLTLLEMDPNAGGFTDYFVICSGANPRQIQAIADEVEMRLERHGLRPNSKEGYQQAEWVLLDYVDFVVHVFSEKSRRYYDLERLWKSAKRFRGDELRQAVQKKLAPAKKPAARKTAARTSAAKKTTGRRAATKRAAATKSSARRRK